MCIVVRSRTHVGMVMMCRRGIGMVCERARVFMTYRSIQCRCVGIDW